ncbi:MAG: 50S ribosomal protein L21 [Actinomycetota bacterium]
MYAIIRAGGHQEKVSVGEVITVDHLKQDPDSTITFVPLLVSSEDGVVSDRKQLADTALVTGRVVEHARGDKIDVFHYRQKTGFRKHTGHRSMLTLVEISEIKIGDKTVTLQDARATNEKAEEEKAQARKAAEEARTAARAEREQKEKDRKTASKKTPAKKTAAASAKKTTAKKTAAKKSSAKKG